MSDVDETTDADTTDDTKSPKALRQQNSKLNQQLTEALAEIAKFKTEQRKSTIAETLSAKGANPKLARFADADLTGEITTEAVEAWLATEGELFGYQPESVEENDAAQQQQRISAATAAAPAQTAGLTVAGINNMTDKQFEEWMNNSS